MNNNTQMPDRLKHALVFSEKRDEKFCEKFGGFVYVIQCCDLVKVGVAKNVLKRIQIMQTGNPFELKLLVSFKSNCPYREEGKIHRLWDQYRIRKRSEWFKVPPEILDRLIILKDKPDNSDEN